MSAKSQFSEVRRRGVQLAQLSMILWDSE